MEQKGVNSKRLITYSLLFLLSLSIFIFLIQVVSAETLAEGALKKINLESINFPDKISNFGSSDFFLKFLIFALVALIIYSISPFLPFLEEGTGTAKNLIRWGVTLIIAYLATYSLRIEEIKLILVSYGALGLVIVGVIPFFAIAAASKRLAEKGHAFFGKALWLIFFFVLFYRLFFVVDLGAEKIGGGYIIAYTVLLVLIGIMFLWENRIWLILFKQNVRNFRDQYRKEQIADIESELEVMNRQIAGTSDKQVEQVLVNKYNIKAAKLRKLGVNWKNWGG